MLVLGKSIAKMKNSKYQKLARPKRTNDNLNVNKVWVWARPVPRHCLGPDPKLKEAIFKNKELSQKRVIELHAQVYLLMVF